MTMIANTQHVSSVLEAVRDEFAIEHGQVMAGLSAAATRYVEQAVPPGLDYLPDPMRAYLNHGRTIGFRYQGLSTPQILIPGAAGVFPELSQIPLLREVVTPRSPAVLPLYLDKPEGVAVDAALAAMEELIDRVNRRIADLTTTHREDAQ